MPGDTSFDMTIAIPSALVATTTTHSTREVEEYLYRHPKVQVTAWRLSQRWTTCRLQFLDDAGHGGENSFLPAVIDALRACRPGCRKPPNRGVAGRRPRASAVIGLDRRKLARHHCASR